MVSWSDDLDTKFFSYFFTDCATCSLSIFIINPLSSHFYLKIFIILSSHLSFSSVNVLLTFNDSLNIFAPSSPILLPVHYQLH